MKPLVLIPATAVCAVLGWLLPPVWTAKEKPAPRRIPVLPAAEKSSSTFAGSIRKAGSPVAQFQAVMAGVKGRARSLNVEEDALDEPRPETMARAQKRLFPERVGLARVLRASEGFPGLFVAPHAQKRP